MYEKLYCRIAGGENFHYLKYTPKNEGDEKKPLLVFMHGAGERGKRDGSELEKVALYGYFKDVADGKDFPFIMVAPQCPENEYWGSFIESLNRFLDKIIAENNVDTDRIYLTGMSMGGTASWMWGLSSPERFAAIAPVCGSGIGWYAEKLIDTPVRAFHGDIDNIVSPHESLEMVSSINRRGGSAELILFHGAKHNISAMAYNDDLLKWFMSHSKDSNTIAI